MSNITFNCFYHIPVLELVFNLKNGERKRGGHRTNYRIPSRQTLFSCASSRAPRRYVRRSKDRSRHLPLSINHLSRCHRPTGDGQYNTYPTIDIQIGNPCEIDHFLAMLRGLKTRGVTQDDQFMIRAETTNVFLVARSAN